jgi:hypothetical protein
MRRWTVLVPFVLTVAAGGALAACNDIAPAGSAGRAAPASPGASPTGEILPSFPELTGDVTTSVRLLSYDPDHRAAIVEPILFESGQDYCKALHVDPLDERCSRDLMTENSNTRVTLPLSGRVDLRDIGDGDSDCFGTMTTGATCKATDRDMLQLADGKAAVRIALRDGEVVRIAELYQP